MAKLNPIAMLGIVSTMSLLAGCRQDMHNQPKFYPQRSTSFYTDGRSVRPQVAGTVARGQLETGSYLNTGLIEGKEGDGMPFPVTLNVLARGQERYNIYCAPCHSRVGNGAGMIVQRGYHPAGNLLGLRLRSVGLGHFFSVITNGYGAMPDYAAQVTVEDRWAIAAYIRALQLSQSAKSTDVPAGAQAKPLQTIAQNEGLPESFAQEWDTVTPAVPPVTQTIVAKLVVEQPATPAPADPKAATKAPGAPATTAAGTTPAKITAAATPPPPAPKRIDLEAGKAIYVAKCQVCHKADLNGKPPMFPSIVNAVSTVGAASVRKTIHEGHPPMPAFPNLSPDELDELIAYLSDPAKAP